MARIKLKLGDNEVEIESRDFYVDNDSFSQIITNVSQLLQDNQAKIIYENTPQETLPSSQPEPISNGLEYLDDAEAFESEFDQPKSIDLHEVKSKLRILETSGFFNSPRTVTETVQQLREYGWAASPLDVSKSLAKMASNREINRNSDDNRIHYFVESAIIN